MSKEMSSAVRITASASRQPADRVATDCWGVPEINSYRDDSHEW